MTWKVPHSMMGPLLAAVFLMGALIGTSGCTTSMSYATHPKTLEPGELQASAVTQADINTNVFSEIDQIKSTAEQSVVDATNGESLGEEEFRQVLDSVVTFGLFRPTVAPEVILRGGIIDGMDAGVRYNGATVKADVKARLWQSPDQRKVVSLMGGMGRQSSAAPSFIEKVTLSKFSRTDADVAVMFGWDANDYFRAYVGPRFVYSWISVEPKISDTVREAIPQEYRDYEPSQYFEDENLMYVGGTGGIMAGYKFIWVTLEATVMHMSFEPKILGQTRDLSGFLVAPVVGLTFEY